MNEIKKGHKNLRCYINIKMIDNKWRIHVFIIFSSSLSSDSAIDRGDANSAELAGRLQELEMELM